MNERLEKEAELKSVLSLIFKEFDRRNLSFEFTVNVCCNLLAAELSIRNIPEEGVEKIFEVIRNIIKDDKILFKKNGLFHEK